MIAYDNVDAFGMGNTVEYTVKESNIKNIDMKFVSEKIQVYIGEYTDIRLVQSTSYNIGEADRLNLRVVGETVTIEKPALKHLFNFINIFNKREAITLYLPRSYQEGLNVKTVSGNIYLEGLELEALECDTTSGEVEVEDVGVKKELEINTVSGDINFKDIKSKNIHFNTTSGDIKLDEIVVEMIECGSTSGDIEFKGLGDYFKMSTTSGEIKVALAKMFKELTSSSVSGDVKVSIPDNSGFKLKYSTTSGDLDSDFDLNQSIYKENNVQMTVRTTSGDLDIVKQ